MHVVARWLCWLKPEKTEVMWAGHQTQELGVRLDGKEIKEVVSFGGVVAGEEHLEADMKQERELGEM